jgi:hypothetical protein
VASSVVLEALKDGDERRRALDRRVAGLCQDVDAASSGLSIRQDQSPTDRILAPKNKRDHLGCEALDTGTFRDPPG